MKKYFLIHLLLLLLITSLVEGKQLITEDGITAGTASYHIRTDGLACYFCSYGLERFFKKTKRIYSMDINMHTGMVSIQFAKGKPIPSAEDLMRYVYDAGFTARYIEVELQGRFSADKKSFRLADNNQTFKIKSIKPMVASGKLVTISGRIEKNNALLIEKLK